MNVCWAVLIETVPVDAWDDLRWDLEQPIKDQRQSMAERIKASQAMGRGHVVFVGGEQ